MGQMELSGKVLFNEAKLQNSKGYAESLDTLPALRLFKKESVATTWGKLDPYFDRSQFF